VHTWTKGNERKGKGRQGKMREGEELIGQRKKGSEEMEMGMEHGTGTGTRR
jgi:hypothetical protein